MKRQRKYDYYFVIQGNYGCGWEDLSQYPIEDRRSCSSDFREYRIAEREFSHRIIQRRVPFGK